MSRLREHMGSYFGFWICTAAVISNGINAVFGHRYFWTWPLFGILVTLYASACCLTLGIRRSNATIAVLDRRIAELRRQAGDDGPGRHRDDE